MYGDWRDSHFDIMSKFMSELNLTIKGAVLKGGTSLMLCYGLDRFSEDIDLDVTDRKIILQRFVCSFCEKYGITYRIAKNTDTVKRYMIHYGGNKPLKVEVSYRQMADKQDVCYINDILVYTISELFNQKLIAYNGRSKIRDLFDIMFIYRNYYKYLASMQVSQLKRVVSYKGLSDAEMLVREQPDDLINSDKLIVDYLDLWNSLGLL